jgi:peptidoglycan hydrolase-like protein with peptidoglycan-binding domain
VATLYLRSPFNSNRAAQRAHRKLTSASTPPRRGRPWVRYVGAGVLTVAIVFGALALIFTSSKATLTADSAGLARVGMPLGGATVERVSAVTTGKHPHPVAVNLSGGRIFPAGKVTAGKHLELTVVVRRPGWLSWLTGSTQTLHLSVATPVASLRSHFLTIHGASSPLVLSFKEPVVRVSYGQVGHMTSKTLATPQTEVTLPRPAAAGTELVSAVARDWEKSKSAAISWFPAGGSATVIAQPAPGGTISANTPITLTFSKPVSRVLSGHMPVVTPAGSGSWQTLGSHAIRFVPSGYGYGLGADVSVALPSGVQIVGGHAARGTWTVPVGSTLRLQQLLATLGYLPFKLSYAGGNGVPTTPLAQEQAATTPPQATFNWAYPNIPSGLRSMWAPGTAGTMTKGALMAFQSDQGLTTDGVAGASVWRSLITAVDKNQVRPGGAGGGYTYVMVTMGSPEMLHLWHNGKTVFSTLVNTGISVAPTATGTYPVFEHLLSTTMSGTNPDGSHYSDPGIPFTSYFNGGDALHGFIRGSYGSPQSLGCVEMSFADAGKVYPYTPIGTLVNVA